MILDQQSKPIQQVEHLSYMIPQKYLLLRINIGTPQAHLLVCTSVEIGVGAAKTKLHEHP